MVEAHQTDYTTNYKIGFQEYLKQFFVGHYNPRGNFFCAFAAKNALVDLLDPKPMAYLDNPDILPRQIPITGTLGIQNSY